MSQFLSTLPSPDSFLMSFITPKVVSRLVQHDLKLVVYVRLEIYSVKTLCWENSLPLSSVTTLGTLTNLIFPSPLLIVVFKYIVNIFQKYYLFIKHFVARLLDKILFHSQ